MPYYEFTLKQGRGWTVRGYGADAIAALRSAGQIWGVEIEPPFDRIANWTVDNLGEDPEER